MTSSRPVPQFMQAIGLLLGLCELAGCQAGEVEAPAIPLRDAIGASANAQETARMWMTVGERRFAITLADTDAARAFSAQFPVTLEMSELNGNEKHADLKEALPVDPCVPGTIHSGDLMLYGSNTVVVFYDTFRSPYSYTRLGRVDDAKGLSTTLGKSSASILFEKE